MKKLTVIYDPLCGMCVKCRWWMVDQPAYVKLDFLPTGSAEIARRWRGLETRNELTVVSDEGGIYRGTDAWLMCLWALEEYRELSLRLASPILKPLARASFKILSENRRRLARWLGWASEAELIEVLREGGGPACATR